eukprot:6036590-Prymnesium_polylepis.1
MHKAHAQPPTRGPSGGSRGPGLGARGGEAGPGRHAPPYEAKRRAGSRAARCRPPRGQRRAPAA